MGMHFHTSSGFEMSDMSQAQAIAKTRAFLDSR
jgi:hypothetical protein